MKNITVDPGPKVSPTSARKWASDLNTLQAVADGANLARKVTWAGASSYDEALAAFARTRAQLTAALAPLTQRNGATPSRLESAEAEASLSAAAGAAVAAARAALRGAFKVSSSRLLGSVDTRVPLLLLPVRLETRFERPAPAAPPSALRIRIYPDDLHVDSHEPALTPEERCWGEGYWQRRGATGSDTDRAAWQQLASHFGLRRAGWIALATDPAETAVPSRAARWTRAAQARLLPDRWLALAFCGTRLETFALGGRIADPLAMGPSPVAGAAPAAVDGVPPVDAGMRWMVDFETALQSGMALRLALTPALSFGIDRLLVVGVHAALDEGQTATGLRSLLDAHRFTGGLGLLPLNVATNNMLDAQAGHADGAPTDPSSAEVDKAFALERARNSTPADSTLPAAELRQDGHWLAWGLGLAPNTFLWSANANGGDTNLALGALASLAPHVDSPLLRRLALGAQHPGAVMPLATASGLLPTLRAGSQPYAVLPVMAASDVATSTGSWASRSSPLRWELGRRAAAARSFRQIADIETLLSHAGAGASYYQTTFHGGAATGTGTPLGAAAARAPYAPWLPQGCVDTCGRDALDAVEGRPDVWISALANERLAALRAATADGLRVGAWGYVEDLVPAPVAQEVTAPDGLGGSVLSSPANQGYLQTPSPAHAITAAVLRSGFKPGDAAKSTASINLSSERVRRAKWLLDGAREGVSLGALLGYRFERRLQDAGLASYIARFRVLAGLRRDDDIGTALADVDKARADQALQQARQRAINAAHATLAARIQAQKQADKERDAYQATKQLVDTLNDLLALQPALVEGKRAELVTHAATRPRGSADYDAPGRPNRINYVDPDPGEFETWTEAHHALEVELANARRAMAAMQMRLASWAPAHAAALSNLAPDGQASLRSSAAAHAVEQAEKAILTLPAADLMGATDRLGNARQTLVVLTRQAWTHAQTTAVASRGVDGLELQRRWHIAHAVEGSAPEWNGRTIPFGDAALGFPGPAGADPDDAADYQHLLLQLERLAEEVDAIGDLSVAEGVFQLIAGNPGRASAALDVLSEAGAMPPVDYDVVRSPRSGVAITHRVLMLWPSASVAPSGWPTRSDSVRALADPALEAMAATLLPAAATIVAVGDVAWNDGAVPTPLVLSADVLDLSALEFIAVARASNEWGNGSTDNELAALLSAAYRARNPALPAAAVVRWLPLSTQGIEVGQLAMADAVELAATLQQLLSSARAFDARDLGAADGGVDIGEATQRVQAVRDATRALASAVDAELAKPDPVPDDIGVALLQAWLARASHWRVAGAADESAATPASLSAGALRLRATSVRKELQTRLDRCGELAAAADFETLLEQLRTLLGADAVMLPRVASAAGSVAQWDASMADGAALVPGAADAAATAAQTWLQHAGYVREGAGQLQRLLDYCAALQRPGARALVPGQYPWAAGERWVGLPPAAGTPLLRGRSATLVHCPLGAVRPDGLTGICVDAWTEVVPSGQDTAAWKAELGPVATEYAGVAFHYDCPSAAAPNVALLTVAEHDATWDLDILERTVIEAVDLAKARAAPADGRTEITWFADEVPAGAMAASNYAESWPWIRHRPAPLEGRRSHRDLAAPGFHQHVFTGAMPIAAMRVEPGDGLALHVYLERGAMPQVLVVQWVVATASGADDWEHRAVWCSRASYVAAEPWAGHFPHGAPGTASRHWAGSLPPAGGWVRLEVQAAEVGLEGQVVTGMAFGTIDGGATWGPTGRLVAATAARRANAMRKDEVWFHERAPTGAALTSTYPGAAWQWVSERPAPFNGGAARLSHWTPAAAGVHRHGFVHSPRRLTVCAGDILFVHVCLAAAALPSAVIVQWTVVDDAEHRAFWGAPVALAGFPPLGSAALHCAGDIPAAGVWVRLEVDAAALGLEGRTIDGIDFVLVDGAAAWGSSGISREALATMLIGA